MPRIQIKQPEKKNNDSIIVETGSDQKFTSGSSQKGRIESRTLYQDSTGTD